MTSTSSDPTPPRWLSDDSVDRSPLGLAVVALSKVADERDEARRERDVARTERDRVIDALADCVIKSANYGEQDGGFVAFYISPTGPIHRAIPLLAEFGITVRPGFDGRTRPVAGALDITTQPAGEK